jgi:hypothetical protein
MDSEQVISNEIGAIFEQWQGFGDPSIETMSQNSLWGLFAESKNNSILSKYVLDTLPDSPIYKKLKSNLLYASICLLSPATSEMKPVDKYKFIIKQGFGVIRFENSNTNKFFGWDKLLIDSYAEFHFDNRISIYRLCNDYRCVSSAATCIGNKRKQGEHCSPIICVKSEDSCKHNKCKTHEKCFVIYEKVNLNIQADSEYRFIAPRGFNELIKKYTDSKFKNYLDWMLENTGPCYYIRKPLVNASKHYNFGEIYLAIRYDEAIANIKAKNIESFALDAIRSVRDYIGVPLLVRQMEVEQEKIDRQKIELEQKKSILEQKNQELRKSDQKLKLLTAPLASLTTALQRMQEDSQTLRSILYDPHRSILAAAPTTWIYFESTSLRFGNLTWDGFHSGAQSRNVRGLIYSISAIVCEIYGKSSELICSDLELFHIALGLIHKSKPPILKSILNWDICLIKNIFALLKLKNIDTIEGIPDEMSTLSNKIKAPLEASFDKFKSILFTPFKSDAFSWPYLPLGLVLYSYNPQLHVLIDGESIENFNRYMDTTSVKSSALFAGVDTITPAYNMFIAFIDDILEYARHDKQVMPKLVNLEVRRNNFTRFELTFESEVYYQDELPATFKIMKTVIDNNFYVAQTSGNFRRPFVKLAANAIPCINKIKGSERFNVECDEASISITHGSSITVINISECTVTLLTKRENA